MSSPRQTGVPRISQLAVAAALQESLVVERPPPLAQIPVADPHALRFDASQVFGFLVLPEDDRLRNQNIVKGSPDPAFLRAGTLRRLTELEHACNVRAWGYWHQGGERPTQKQAMELLTRVTDPRFERDAREARRLRALVADLDALLAKRDESREAEARRRLAAEAEHREREEFARHEEAERELRFQEWRQTRPGEPPQSSY